MDVISERDESRLLRRNISEKMHSGMPPLDKVDRPVSYFEFWPGFVFYIPVFFQWVLLAIRYRGLSLPLNANPRISLSGMVGEAKSDIFSMTTGEADKKIASWALVTQWQTPEDALFQIKQKMLEKNLAYPVVVKPDTGCRGAGVQKIKSDQELLKYVEKFPQNGKIIVQKLVPYEAEAGIFYIRYPGTPKGEIFSITLKYQPYVVGNGIDTLQQLIEKDPRSGRLKHLYLYRHKDKLGDIISAGQPYRLAFAGSHSKGSIFRDGREFITPGLAKSLDQICDGIPEFHYGRFDVKFRDIDSLMNGSNYYIVEINGASSEAAHIWDCRGSLKEVFRVLFYQYQTLFQIGAINRRRGFKPPPLTRLLKAWWQEKRLLKRYPTTK